MARRFTNYNGVQKPISAGVAQTISWGGNDIESDGVIAYHVALQAAGNTIADIDRIRVKANGVTQWDVAIAHYRAWLQRVSPANLAYATTGQALSIWLNMPSARTTDEQDAVQFPVNTQATVEIVMNSGAAAGVAIIGWTKTSAAPAWSSRFFTQQINVAASANNFTFPLADDGVVQFVTINSVGVDQAQLWLSGELVINVPGAQYSALASIGDMLSDIQAISNQGTVTDPIALKIDSGTPAASGNSKLVLTTGAAWAGTANQFGLFSLVPNGVATR